LVLAIDWQKNRRKHYSIKKTSSMSSIRHNSSFLRPLYVVMFLFVSCTIGFAQEAKVYTFSSAKFGNARIISLVGVRDTVKITANIVSTTASKRSIVAPTGTVNVVWNKEKKKNELYLQSGELLGENGSNQRDFFNFTPAQGSPLTMVKISKTEWHYTCKEKTLVRIKTLDKRTVEVTMLDDTQPESALALLMAYAYASDVVDAAGISPIYVVSIVLVAIMRASM
jgi:hypothetical protein